MTIHHDKLAYGKLQSQTEEMTDEEILNMLKNLKEEEKEDSTGKFNENNGDKLKKL